MSVHRKWVSVYPFHGPNYSTKKISKVLKIKSQYPFKKGTESKVQALGIEKTSISQLKTVDSAKKRCYLS